MGKIAVAEAYANDGSSTIYTVHLANLEVHAMPLCSWSCLSLHFVNPKSNKPEREIKTAV